MSVEKKIAQRVASRYWETSSGRVKTAGEVIFRKDNTNDAGAWAFGTPGGSSRTIDPNFEFAPKSLKPLAKTLRSASAALGHVISTYNQFAKLKSSQISPDGHLGGRGYIQKIPDMRRQLMNCVEALSSFTDTVRDELAGPHWAAAQRRRNPKVQKEVKELLSEADEIRQDPEQWAEESMDTEFGD